MITKLISTTILLLLFLVSGCAEDNARQFKSIANELRNQLVKLGEIKPVTRETEVNGKDIITIDLTRKAEFVRNNADIYDSIAGKLAVFSNENKESVWGDDAAFLAVMEYLSISIPGNDYQDETIQMISSFIAEYPNIKVENWTKNHFENIPLFYILDEKKISDADLFGHRNLKLTISERIEAYLLFSLVNEHLKKGDLAGAENAYAEISSNIKHEWLKQNIEETIDAYKSRAELLRMTSGLR